MDSKKVVELKPVSDPPPLERGTEWSTHRAKQHRSEKKAMGTDFGEHCFLVRHGMDPETKPRETAASILVNPGTTPRVVVEQSLQWVKDHLGDGPYEITWYTPGALVPALLREFSVENPACGNATTLCVFPGRVDDNLQSVEGTEAVSFARQLKKQDECFTYALLSVHSFDITTGKVYFYFAREVELQRECASLYATHKFLFLDHSKFRREGKFGYTIYDLLSTSEAVTIYTSSSDANSWIEKKFNTLCSNLLSEQEPTTDARDMKKLVLRVVGSATVLSKQGLLRDREEEVTVPQ